MIKKPALLFLPLLILALFACPDPQDTKPPVKTATPLAAPTIPPSFNININCEPPVSSVTITVIGINSNVGIELNLEAQPAAGYLFDHWEDGDGYTVGEDNPKRFFTQGDLNITAVYVKAYTLTILTDPEDVGIDNISLIFDSENIDPTPSEMIFAENTMLDLYANFMPSGLFFDHWEWKNTGTTITTLVFDTHILPAMDADKTLTAVFVYNGTRALQWAGPIAQDIKTYISENYPATEEENTAGEMWRTIPGYGIDGGDCVYHYTQIFFPDIYFSWEFHNFKTSDGTIINTGANLFTEYWDFLSGEGNTGTLKGDINLYDHFGNYYTMSYDYTYQYDISDPEKDDVLNGEALNGGTCIINDKVYDHTYSYIYSL